MGDDSFCANLELLIKSLDAHSVEDLTPKPTAQSHSISNPVDHILAEVLTITVEDTPNTATTVANIEAPNQAPSSSRQLRSSTRTTQASPDKNPLILNTKRERKIHSYKELDRRDFAKAAITVKTPKHSVKTPKTYDKAIASPEAEQWKKAIVTEVANQVKKGLYNLVSPVPGKPIIKGKWVYKVKEHPDGSIKKFRARWCAKGYTQKKDRDYDKIIAPVVRSDTSRILLAIAAVKNWLIRQFDVETAFLNSKMDRVLYIEQPTGYKQRDLVCRLNNALYGLVQSAHLWFEDLKSTLLKMGFVQSKHGDALFYDTANETYVTLYVNDIKVFAPSHDWIDTVKEKLFAKYKMTDEGDMKWYLGMEINRLSDRALLLTQTKYMIFWHAMVWRIAPEY